MKQVKWIAALLVVAGLNFSCQSAKDEAVDPSYSLAPVDDKTLVNSDFRSSTEGWTGDYTDYDAVQEGLIEFEFKHEALPAPLDVTKKAIKVSGHNRSDDLFLFLKRRVTNLKPNTTYRLVFDVELASEESTNGIGIGGSPGSSVYLKAGASATEPAKVKQNSFYNFSLDKGNQSVGGKDLMVLGHIGAGNDVTAYTLIQRNNASQPFAATTNAQCELWLIVGTDSGYEGLTTLYYNRIKVTVL